MLWQPLLLTGLGGTLAIVGGVGQRIDPFDPTAWVTAIDAYVERARGDLIPGGPGGGQPKKTSASA